MLRCPRRSSREEGEHVLQLVFGDPRVRLSKRVFRVWAIEICSSCSIQPHGTQIWVWDAWGQFHSQNFTCVGLAREAPRRLLRAEWIFDAARIKLLQLASGGQEVDRMFYQMNTNHEIAEIPGDIANTWTWACNSPFHFIAHC